jgi:hypothetical protein
MENQQPLTTFIVQNIAYNIAKEIKSTDTVEDMTKLISDKLSLYTLLAKYTHDK